MQVIITKIYNFKRNHIIDTTTNDNIHLKQF